MTLGYMRPRNAFDYIHDSFLGNPILSRQCSLGNVACRVSLADFCHLIFSQFGIALIFTAPLTTLSYLVIHVCLVSTKPKVRRIHASGIVPPWAIMAYKHTIRNISKVDNVGHAGGVVDFTLPCTTTIPTVYLTALPQPALIWFALVYKSPKLHDFIPAILMTNKVARWLTLCPSMTQVCFPGYARLLSTTAHAQATWIWGRQTKTDSSVVAAQKSKVLSLLCASSMIALIRNVGRFIASTLAFSVGRKQSEFSYPFRVIFEIGGKVRLALGRVRGMIFHSNSSPLVAVARSQDAPTSLAISIPFTRSIVAQKGYERNAPVAELSASPC